MIRNKAASFARSARLKTCHDMNYSLLAWATITHHNRPGRLGGRRGALATSKEVKLQVKCKEIASKSVYSFFLGLEKGQPVDSLTVARILSALRRRGSTNFVERKLRGVTTRSASSSWPSLGKEMVRRRIKGKDAVPLQDEASASSVFDAVLLRRSNMGFGELLRGSGPHSLKKLGRREVGVDAAIGDVNADDGP